MTGKRPIVLYWIVVALYASLLAWWVVFFSRQGDHVVQRAAEMGAPLDSAQARAVRDATRGTMRMFLAEGAFVGVVLLSGFWLVLRAVRRQAELHRQQREFLSGVTHELRSPIASAKLFLESLMLGRVKGEKADRYLRKAHGDLGRLQEHVEQLLSSARVANSGVEVHPESMDLAAFLQDVQGELKTDAAMQGAQLEVHATQPVGVVADPQALRTILRNLISNAIKYGGDSPRVEVTVRREGRNGVLEVRDWGPGLQGVSRRRVFDAFQRGNAEAVATKPGTGLGLFMVAELTRALDGSVAADDHPPGGGTRLVVALPGQEA